MAQESATATLRVLLVLLLSMHALSSALILPTLPLLTMWDSAARQWAFSALILGFGVTQILWGSLADRLGRRPALLAGLLLFVAASLGCFVATTLASLVICRLLQGAGVAAAGVCARAIVRDLYSAELLVVVLSRCFSWISAISLAGPFVGSMLVRSHGVAGALAAYGALGLLSLAVAFFGLRETLGTNGTSGNAQEASINWRGIWRQPVFRVYTALTACSYLGHYLFLSGSAHMLIEQGGLSVVEYGAVLSCCSLFYLGGTVACRHGLRALGLRRTVGGASLIGLAGGAALGMAAICGARSAAAFAVPYMLFVFAHAVHQSCGQAAAMAPFKAAAGRANAWLGTTLPLVAVSAGALLAPAQSASAAVLPLAICGAAVLTSIVAWTGVRPHGDIARYSEQQATEPT